MFYCLHPNGEKLPADIEVMQKYGYQVGDTTPFTGLLIEEETVSMSITTTTPEISAY